MELLLSTLKNIWYKVRFNLRIYYMLEVIIIQYDIINFLNPLNRCSIFSFSSCQNPLLAEVIVRGIFPAWKSLQTARLYWCPFWRMFPRTWLSTFSKYNKNYFYYETGNRLKTIPLEPLLSSWRLVVFQILHHICCQQEVQGIPPDYLSPWDN